MPGFIIFVLFLLLVAGFIVISSLYGSSNNPLPSSSASDDIKISDSGIHMRAPFLASIKIAARVQLRLAE